MLQKIYVHQATSYELVYHYQLLYLEKKRLNNEDSVADAEFSVAICETEINEGIEQDDVNFTTANLISTDMEDPAENLTWNLSKRRF